MNSALAETTEVKQSLDSTLARVTGAVLMLGVAYIHWLDLGGKMTEVPYLGYLLPSSPGRSSRPHYSSPAPERAGRWALHWLLRL